ncbi:hypothetical protein ACSFA8_22650 [Variovorax sp. RT4R15]|uniref:hypothetical protein n=1 Tax=Variovorax sp. RT4R15 TaxID=3443737 RepID=UPI003F4635F5
MSLRFKHLLLGACCAIGIAATAHAGENCALVAPPRAAAVNADHGSFLFVFPRNVEASYSGCQTMWNERGATVFVLKFERGVLASYQEFEEPRKKATLTCKYSGHALKTRSDKCPAYEDVGAGFRTLPEADEPRIPVEGDPRKG